jgi:hypothetical protein
MPQRLFDEYEDNLSYYSEDDDFYSEDERYGEEEPYYEEELASPCEVSPAKSYKEEYTYKEQERSSTPLDDSWPTLFHSLRNASEGIDSLDPFPSVVTWKDLFSFMKTIRPPPPPQTPNVEIVLPETSPRLEKMEKDLLQKEEDYLIVKKDLKDLTTTLNTLLEKQRTTAEALAQQEKKKPYKWGPQPKKVDTFLDTQLKTIEADLKILRENVSKATTKEATLRKELVGDRKDIEDEKVNWQILRKYRSFEHTTLGYLPSD